MSLTLPLVLSMCASVVSVFFISAASVSNQVLCVSLLSLYLFISLSLISSPLSLCVFVHPILVYSCMKPYLQLFLLLSAISLSLTPLSLMLGVIHC